MLETKSKPMEILEGITLANLPGKLRQLKTPVTAHVRVFVQEIKEHPRKTRPRFAKTPGHGLWKDREDLDDPTAFINARRLTRCPDVF